jgi:hypothetical protein
MSAACDDGEHGCCVQPRASAMYASCVITRQATTVLVPGQCAPILMSTCSIYGCFNRCANNYVPRSVIGRCEISNNSAPAVRKHSFVVTLRCLELREPAAIARTYASLLVKPTNPTKRTLRKQIRRNFVETCPCTHSGTKVLTSHGHRQNGRCC